MHDSLASRGVRVVVVTNDEPRDAAVRAFPAGPLPLVRSTGTATRRALGTTGYPETLVLDERGNVIAARRTRITATDARDLERRIVDHLARSAPYAVPGTEGGRTAPAPPGIGSAPSPAPPPPASAAAPPAAPGALASPEHAGTTWRVGAVGARTPRHMSRPPMIGLRCAAVAGCDRVGVAVWPTRDVAAVRVTVAGRSGNMRRRAGAPFLEASLSGVGVAPVTARFRGTSAPDAPWAGSPPLWTSATFRITLRDGRTRVVRAPVPLSPGWG